MRREYLDGSGATLTDQLLDRMLEAAADSRPTPVHSHYAVRGALATSTGRIITGSNHEYAGAKALHCEETLVGRWLEEAPDEEAVAVAFLGSGGVPTPCGNCRDILRAHLSPDALIAGGSPQGMDGHVRSLSDYLFEDWNESPSSRDPVGLIGAGRALRRAETMKTHAASVYGALLVSEDRTHPGVYVEGIDYHPVRPIAAAIAGYYGNGHGAVDRLVVAAEGRPDVPYVERQRLYEFSRKLDERGLAEHPLAVTIYDLDLLTLRAWRTDAEEWLPHAFHPEL